MAKKTLLKTFEVTYSVNENHPITLKIEGLSIAAYALGDADGSSCFAIYGEDGKTPVLMVSWNSFIMCRLASETEVLKIKRSRVVDLEESDDNEKEISVDS